MQNQTINGYTLLRKIGVGGMAEVWYAENRLKKPAAIKLLKEDFFKMKEVLSRFENEAAVMVGLVHPYIRQVYDYGELDERPCIIMEYLDGSDLSARLKNGERFTDAQLRDWWNQLVEALDYTHTRGVVHRDIKPSNIFLTSDGKVKLLDFGIAKVKGGITATQTGTRMGTLMYMSPEQVKDSTYVDYRSDIYSLGVTFYHLVTGRAPYDNTSSSEFEIQTMIVTEPLQLDILPQAWRNVLEPCLHKDFQKRPDLKSLGDQTVQNNNTFETETTVIISTPTSNLSGMPHPQSDAQSNGKKNKAMYKVLGVVAFIIAFFLLFYSIISVHSISYPVMGVVAILLLFGGLLIYGTSGKNAN